MSLCDCEKCWNTPCTCGYDYKDYGAEGIKNFIIGILSYQTRKTIDEVIRFLIKKNPPEDIESFNQMWNEMYQERKTYKEKLS